MPEKQSMRVDNLDITITGKPVRIARLTHERYVDVNAPEPVLELIKLQQIKADIFTFCQRLPESKPKYNNYYMEYDSIAAVPISNYEYWLEQQIPKQTRTSLKKAEKKGVIVKQAAFDDEFIKGMTSIFNESPIRQGRPFWHYGKNFEAVKKEFSLYAFREDHIGAYYNDELIGFLFFADAGRYAITIQIISKIAHQDKKPNNALIAKAIEICAEKKIPWLVYGKWARGTWGEFKRHNGFENVVLPRYYIPLSVKGRAVLRLRLHNGIVGLLPEKIILRLRDMREKFYSMRYKEAIKYRGGTIDR